MRNLIFKSHNTDNYTVIFNSNLVEDDKIIIDDLKEFNVLNNYTTEYFYFTFIKQNEDRDMLFKNLKNNLRFQSRLKICYYNDSGDFFDENKIVITKDFEEQIKISGLLKIISENDGIMYSNESFHYIYPSGKHSDFFIRLANVLNCKNSIVFFSFCLLKYIRPDVKNIYYDTSSIISILFGIEIIKRLFDKTHDLEFIGFESYDGVDSINFIPNSIIIISASNSENLSNKIKKKDQSLICINLVLNCPKGNSKVEHLINVNSQLRLNEHKIYQNEFECTLCQKGSIPVQIRGEQFLPIKPVIKELLLSNRCKPNWLDSFLNDFVGTKTISCNKIEKGSNKRRELFLDLSKYHNEIIGINFSEFENEPFDKKEERAYITQLKWFINNELSLKTSYIIHLNDDSSIVIAQSFEKFLYLKGLTVKLLSEAKVSNEPLVTSENNVILVIASCCSTGHRLLKISSDLRKYPNYTIHYLIGVSRLIDKNQVQNLKSELELRNEKGIKNKFTILSKISLPNNHSKHSSHKYKGIWECERIELINATKEFGSIPLIDKRIKQLEDEHLESIFWLNPFTNNPLVLNRNFAFYRFEEVYGNQMETIPQAEVFFTIQAILHNLRCKIDLDEQLRGKDFKDVFPLSQDENIRTVLSPRNFERLNDGIIQAAILRACSNGELNYSMDLELSYRMRNVLESITQSSLNEAIIEFLLAIYMRRLVLTKSDLKEFINSFSDKEILKNETIAYFVKIIKKRFEFVS